MTFTLEEHSKYIHDSFQCVVFDKMPWSHSKKSLFVHCQTHPDQESQVLEILNRYQYYPEFSIILIAEMSSKIK